MRYIGGKSKLLLEIEKLIRENIVIDSGDMIFADIFAGSGSVARHFKHYFSVIANDILYFSHVLQKATIENNINFNINTMLIDGKNVCDYLMTLNDNIADPNLFIHDNYSPDSYSNRMYFTARVAKQIDIFRINLEYLLKNDKITEEEYFYLLACLLETVPFYSNITGTYGAYLKYWDKRALKDFELYNLEVQDNKKSNKTFNCDANVLIKNIKGDILYLDPPYNTRQYLPNYHVLETIAKYDYPKINGVTGIRSYSSVEKSDFCSRIRVQDAMEELIAVADFQYIVISYNNEGLIKEPNFESLLAKYSKKNQFVKQIVPYKKYKSKLLHNNRMPLYEIIYLIEKK